MRARLVNASFVICTTHLFTAALCLCQGATGSEDSHGQAPTQKQESGEKGSPLFIFPVASKIDYCDPMITKLVNQIGGVDASCDHFSPFLGSVGMKEKPVVTRAGLGVYPYLFIDGSAVLHPRLAVTIPPIEKEKLKEIDRFRLVGGKKALTLVMGPDTESLRFEGENSSISYGLPINDRVVQFLREFATAGEKYVTYGKDGQLKLEVSKYNGEIISRMLELIDRMTGKEPEKPGN